MASILLNLPDALLKRVDVLISGHASATESPKELQARQAEAVRIAEEQGREAAERYLRARAPRPTRTALLLKYIEEGLLRDEAGKAPIAKKEVN